MKQLIDGIVLLDKAQDISSNRALQQVKSCFNAKKAGHTGSLDPLATGLLPICLGQATKVCAYLLESHKQYVTTIKLGETTDTYDAQGQVLLQRPVDVSDAQLSQALEQFRGAIKQIPPMFSALKRGGKPLYKLARKGQYVERPARDQFVHSLSARRIDDEYVELHVHCDSGFYIRSLAYDLGEILGCGAHVVQLRRSAIKDISVDNAITIEQLQKSPHKHILPVDTLIQDMPRLDIDDAQIQLLLYGKATPYHQERQMGLLRFYQPDNRLFAVGEMREDGILKTQRIFMANDA